MFQDHQSLQKQVYFNTSKHHANELIVGGVHEVKTQTAKAAAVQFFKDKLNVVVEEKDLFHA